MSSHERLDAVIVGAGLAGLIAARALVQAGKRVALVEKSRGVGGRMATRRLAGAVFDHGAQFFTIRSPAFASALVPVAASYRPWGEGFRTEDGELPAEHRGPRYCGVGGMTSVPKALSQGLAIHLNSEVSQVLRSKDGWQAKGRTADAGFEITTKNILFTCPAPQILNLLPATSDAAFQERLRLLTYDPCLALMVLPADPVTLPEPGAIKLAGPVLNWLADNQRKGISPVPALTAHATAEFSAANLTAGPLTSADEERLKTTMLAALKPWLPTAPKEAFLHRWRYATPRGQAASLYDASQGLYACGDAFAGGRVEGAALSGAAAAAAMLRELGS